MKKWHITSVKNCMEKLLISDGFDKLWLESAQITTKNTITIDGHFQKQFFSEEELEEKQSTDKEYLYWKEMRTFYFGLVKGSKTPYYMKIEFLLPEECYDSLIMESGTKELHKEDLSGCFLRFVYQDQQLFMLSGISLKLFSMDKSVEKEWDKKAEEILQKNQIDYEDGEEYHA